MNNQPRFSRAALALSLTTAFCVLQPSFAEQAPEQMAKPATEQAMAKPDVAKLSAAQKVAYLAQAGQMAMGHIETARQSLTNLRADVAKQQLSEAQILLNEVNTNTRERLVPLFVRIGFTEQFEMTDDVQQKLEGLDEHIIKGDHDKVVEVMKTTGVAMAYTHAEMPLAEILTKVDTALKAITDNELDKAEQALAAAIDDIHVETLTVTAETS